MRQKKVRLKPRFYLIILLLIVLIAAAVSILVFEWPISLKNRGGDAQTKEPSPKSPEGGEPGEGEAEPGSEQAASDLEIRSPGAEAAGLPGMITSLEDFPLSSHVDDELLLVNKTHRLTEEYVPADLVEFEKSDPNVGIKETRQLRKPASEALAELLAAAEADGFDMVLRTGYRSYSYQKNLFDGYAEKNGVDAANKYSAKPGESEHQTGLCCDLGVIGRGLTSFNGSKEAAWVAENAHKYGFIVRSLEGKESITGYNYESWHIRYVGEGVAEYIYENEITLEEYLGITQ